MTLSETHSTARTGVLLYNAGAIIALALAGGLLLLLIVVGLVALLVSRLREAPRHRRWFVEPKLLAYVSTIENLSRGLQFISGGSEGVGESGGVAKADVGGGGSGSGAGRRRPAETLPVSDGRGISCCTDRLLQSGDVAGVRAVHFDGTMTSTNAAEVTAATSSTVSGLASHPVLGRRDARVVAARTTYADGRSRPTSGRAGSSAVDVERAKMTTMRTPDSGVIISAVDDSTFDADLDEERRRYRRQRANRTSTAAMPGSVNASLDRRLPAEYWTTTGMLPSWSCVPAAPNDESGWTSAAARNEDESSYFSGRRQLGPSSLLLSSSISSAGGSSRALADRRNDQVVMSLSQMSMNVRSCPDSPLFRQRRWPAAAAADTASGNPGDSLSARGGGGANASAVDQSSSAVRDDGFVYRRSTGAGGAPIFIYQYPNGAFSEALLEHMMPRRIQNRLQRDDGYGEERLPLPLHCSVESSPLPRSSSTCDEDEDDDDDDRSTERRPSTSAGDDSSGDVDAAGSSSGLQTDRRRRRSSLVDDLEDLRRGVAVVNDDDDRRSHLSSSPVVNNFLDRSWEIKTSL